MGTFQALWVKKSIPTLPDWPQEVATHPQPTPSPLAVVRLLSAGGYLEVKAEKKLRGKVLRGAGYEGRRAGRREGKIPQEVPNMT